MTLALTVKKGHRGITARVRSCSYLHIWDSRLMILCRSTSILLARPSAPQHPQLCLTATTWIGRLHDHAEHCERGDQVWRDVEECADVHEDGRGDRDVPDEDGWCGTLSAFARLNG